MMSQDLDVGEQALSKAVEMAIRSQMDAVDTLEVEIHTDPIKLTQGQVDKAVVEGSGLVVNELRTESLMLEARAVDVSMIKAAMGEIDLDEPANAELQVVLKPEDVQTAFNADYVKQKLRGQKVDLPSGERVTTDASNVMFTIPEAGKISVEADVMLMEKVETHHVAFTAKPTLMENGHVVSLEEMEYDDAANDMPELTRSLVESTEELLDLRTFDVGQMSLQFNTIDVQPSKIVIKAQAVIESLS